MSLVVPVGVAALLELLVGDPPTRLHPVAWFGRVVGPLDRDCSVPVVVGTLGTVTLTLGAAGVAAGLVVVAGSRTPLAAALVAGAVLFLSTSLRRLLGAARAVVAASDSDVESAREGLLALAGRDADDLPPGHIRSAAVESSAENLADGLLAPLAGFVLAATLATGVGAPALPLAAAAAAWVKAVNTMDSMLGYRSKPVGTPAARLDDAVMWLPARLSAVALAVALGSVGVLGRVRPWLDGVPSPNSGWPMGVAAAALDVRLEKPGVYVLNPDAPLPDVARARRGVRGVGIAGVLTYALAGLSMAALDAEVPVWF